MFWLARGTAASAAIASQTAIPVQSTGRSRVSAAGAATLAASSHLSRSVKGQGSALSRISTFSRHIISCKGSSAIEGQGSGMEKGLVSCEWLKAELESSKGSLKIVDATWYLPNSPFAAPEGSKGAQADYLSGPRLPGAVFFDIDAVTSKHPDGLPHMLPDEDTFAAAMAAMGIEPDTRVVAYDRLGVFSSPRFWYTLKVVFGHSAEVAVLDGGLPRWQQLGLPVEDGEPALPSAPSAMSRWTKSSAASWDIAQVRANIDKEDKAMLLDARPAGRFHGEVPEPRPGMRGGSIPGSLNLPFLAVQTDGPVRTMLPKEKIQGVLSEAGVPLDSLQASEGKTVVASCGSGLTACVIGLAMHQVGLPLSRLSIYDGSWTEWGAKKDTPIVKRGADGSAEPVP
eukprot:TRINITY_DN22108_c0_g1_i1.p1 TRINITY_DN22108_c0_g1~~TRINITY_DN22108_c0_g1_i1.p1  ORF type:complete len:398 (+),score=59.15 TRINITY_DN22108_c0_g1_i1:99-1292(+)